MRTVPALLLSSLLLLSACSKSNDVYEELPNSSLAGAPRADVPETRMDAPIARPVIIGEDGARLDACGGLGQVARAGPGGLALRAAPFDDAKAIARLAEGQRTWLCTRSIDQKWLGVVVPPARIVGEAAESVDCGVASPVERKQPYAGPCVSGWVASAYIRSIGD
ncbi:hypothetical protein U5A82_21195 [Sphingobium sp. CR2-8]|uniref:hypothetical protein n=1 Tax=Sphingobium sp. CR2-8 TaxID=1306534 RepID=UPI002DBD6B98|nr:hypothetical protein [Sphingobium sp. CR2-8]MEC3912894.1 hypothetical protein [Sphingobium sp. CR2-8]